MESIAESISSGLLSPDRFCEIPIFGVIGGKSGVVQGVVFRSKNCLDCDGEGTQGYHKVARVVSYLYQSLHMFSYGGIKWEVHSKGGKSNHCCTSQAQKW